MTYFILQVANTYVNPVYVYILYDRSDDLNIIFKLNEEKNMIKILLWPYCNFSCKLRPPGKFSSLNVFLGNWKTLSFYVPWCFVFMIDWLIIWCLVLLSSLLAISRWPVFVDECADDNFPIRVLEYQWALRGHNCRIQTKLNSQYWFYNVATFF